MSSVNATIRDTVAAYQQHQSDPEEFLALHGPEVVVVNIAGRRVLGKADVTAAMREALQTPLAKVRSELEIEDIRFPADNVAVVSCVKTVFDERDPAADSTPTHTGVLTLVLVKTADAWQVTLSQTTPRQ